MGNQKIRSATLVKKTTGKTGPRHSALVDSLDRLHAEISGSYLDVKCYLDRLSAVFNLVLDAVVSLIVEEDGGCGSLSKITDFDLTGIFLTKDIVYFQLGKDYFFHQSFDDIQGGNVCKNCQYASFIACFYCSQRN